MTDMWVVLTIAGHIRSEVIIYIYSKYNSDRLLLTMIHDFLPI